MRFPGRSRVLLVAVVLATIGWASGGSAWAEGRIDAQTYHARLIQADVLARRGTTNPSQQLMDALRATLGLPVQVMIADRIVLVPFDPVLSQLPGDFIADFANAHARLSALAAEVGLVLRSTPPSQGKVTSALNDAYRGIGPRNLSWLERIGRAISDALSRFLSNLTDYSGLGTIIEWLAIVALLVVVVRLFMKARLVPDRRVRLKRGPRPRSVTDWVARADHAFARGDVVGAVRALYRALLAALSAGGVTSDSPSLTAGECREAVRRTRPQLYPLVAPATRVYERVIYGLGSSDAATVESLRRAVLEVRSG